MPAPNSSLAHLNAALADIIGQFAHDGLPLRGSVLVRNYTTSLPILFYGVVDALDRAGVDVRIDPALGRIFGSQRDVTAGHANVIWYVTDQSWPRAALLRIPGAHVVASTNPLTPDDDRELLQLQSRLRSELESANRLDLSYQVDSPLIELFTERVPGIDHQVALRVGGAQYPHRPQRRLRMHCDCRDGPGPVRNAPESTASEPVISRAV